MGKTRKSLCVVLPYVFSVASLICLIFVGIGCTHTSSPQSELYFMKVSA